MAYFSYVWAKRLDEHTTKHTEGTRKLHLIESLGEKAILEEMLATAFSSEVGAGGWPPRARVTPRVLVRDLSPWCWGQSRWRAGPASPLKVQVGLRVT